MNRLLCFSIFPLLVSFIVAIYSHNIGRRQASHAVYDTHQCPYYHQFNLTLPSSLWMTCASAEVKRRPLLSLAIPGSHDSFAYWLDDNPDLELAPDIAKWQLHLLSIWSLLWGRQELRTMLKYSSSH